MRQLSLLDRVIAEIDHGLRVVHARPQANTGRPYPAVQVETTQSLNKAETQLAERFMRINHTGEIAAQGLYHGQALLAKNPLVAQKLQHAAKEELDHLDWCQRRLDDLDGRSSYLAPFWYWGSFAIGAMNGLRGDAWSLGFVKETEDQVIRHIDEHLAKLPASDLPDVAVLKQMRADEEQHGSIAMQSGGKRLPFLARKLLMPFLSKVMTKTSYYV